jgi:hypothetical protein
LPSDVTAPGSSLRDTPQAPRAFSCPVLTLPLDHPVRALLSGLPAQAATSIVAREFAPRNAGSMRFMLLAFHQGHAPEWAWPGQVTAHSSEMGYEGSDIEESSADGDGRPPSRSRVSARRFYT